MTKYHHKNNNKLNIEPNFLLKTHENLFKTQKIQRKYYKKALKTIIKSKN